VKDKLAKVEDVIRKIEPGMSVMVGGFGLIGSPLTLIEALCHHEVSGLTIFSNNMGEKNKGLGNLLLQQKVKKIIGSYFTSNSDVVKLHNDNKINVQLLPQGTFAEAIRAGGAGIGGFYIKVGVDTEISNGIEKRIIDGETFLFQKALKADIALIKARKADRLGNLVYYKTAQNFNSDMATAAKIVIVEADEIVEVGEINPEEIVTPHLYIDYIVPSTISLRNYGGDSQ